VTSGERSAERRMQCNVVCRNAEAHDNTPEYAHKISDHDGSRFFLALRRPPFSGVLRRSRNISCVTNVHDAPSSCAKKELCCDEAEPLQHCRESKMSFMYIENLTFPICKAVISLASRVAQIQRGKESKGARPPCHLDEPVRIKWNRVELLQVTLEACRPMSRLAYVVLEQLSKQQLVIRWSTPDIPRIVGDLSPEGS
jgi:hypothetical protein